MNFWEELKARAAQVDKALDEYLPSPDTYPEVIHQAMRYTVFAGGKRLRPVIALATAELAGGDLSAVMPAACALELLHTYSLVHDDLPAMDDDDMRRGRPTCHKVFGEAVAVLAGDALLTLSFQLLARTVENGIPAELVLRVISEVAEAAGTSGLIGGQVVDILSTSSSITPATLEYIHRHKTGALYRVAARTGAILAGAGTDVLDAITRYAEYLGLAFQIKDDILDVEGDAQKIGKPTGSDEKNKKATYPAVFGLQKAREKAAEAADRAVAALSRFGEEAEFLRLLANFVINRDF